ncbi:MAG TPA: protein kinase [Gemmatimonas sp.]|nr:protein kinase [Gemmatimonas sp.]
MPTTLPVPMDDLLPRLQRAFSTTHDFVRELGGGGMSRTYLATERALNRPVVIKVLAPELLAGVSVERFKREVLLAAQLQHPHIVPVLSTGDAEGLPWFTMPYVDGDSLRQRLSAGPVGINEAVGILRDVSRALGFAHGRGVVHRDIKPDNVLLSEGSATVTDFGIAKAINAARTTGANETLTQAGMSIGTPTYMAPEQAAGDPATDHRADLYSFGVMAYELLTGRPPFTGTSPARVLAAQMSEPAPPIREKRPDVPVTLGDLVMACLAKEPTSRPQTAVEISRVLESVVNSGPSASAPAILHGQPVSFGKAVGYWALGAVTVLSLTYAATVSVGLPEWALGAAAVTMVAGLAVIGATAYVQRVSRQRFTSTPTLTPGGGAMPMGTMATMALKASPHLSWRRTWIGGVTAVVAFVLLLGGFMTARAKGIGSMGSLIGKGTLTENDRLILADFRSPAGDTTLGVTITEALRADLSQSKTVRVLSRANVRDVLRLMRRPLDAGVDLGLAREVATREGIKAIVEGEVVSLGSGYVVAARLLATQDGAELGTFRETAADSDELLGAVERLSRKLREKVGESFKDIRAAAPLERVTTSSVDALKQYVQGMRAIEERNDLAAGIPMLEEAIRLDTTFAMAYRKLGQSIGNASGARRQRVMSLLSKAYELRDRLSESERLLTTASYWSSGPREDIRQAIMALEALAERDSSYFPAFNNLAVQQAGIGDFTSAEANYRHAIALEPTIAIGWTNLAVALVNQGRLKALDSLANEAAKALGPDSDVPARVRLWSLGHVDTYRAADSLALSTLKRFGDRLSTRVFFSQVLGTTAGASGRIRESNRYYAQMDSASNLQGNAADRLTTELYGASDQAFFRNDIAGARRAAMETLRRFPFDTVADADRNYGEWGWELHIAGATEAARDIERRLAERYAKSNRRVDARQLARLRAGIALDERRYADAIEGLTAAIAAFPESGVGLYGPTLAEAYEKNNQPDSAIVVLNRYLASTKPSRINNTGIRYNAWSLQRLGDLYEAKGDSARALDAYSRFVELWKDADPELQPVVRDVRARIDRLRRSTDKG